MRPAIENVTSATAYRYLSRDDKGSTLDTLKVIPSPGGGYLGVYHTLTAGVFVTKLARSTNLLTWTHVVDLEPSASQPTIAALSDGGFLVAYEKDAGCTGTGPGGNCLGFRHYAGLASLLAGTGDRSFQAPRTLSRCAEGTPNIYGADLRPDIGHSTIDVGFHYFRNCDVDRQARGTLHNFSAWSANVEGGLNAAFEAFGPGGNIGDRDFMRLGGGSFNIHEVQFAKGDFGTWRVYPLRLALRARDAARDPHAPRQHRLRKPDLHDARVTGGPARRARHVVHPVAGSGTDRGWRADLLPRASVGPAIAVRAAPRPALGIAPHCDTGGLHGQNPDFVGIWPDAARTGRRHGIRGCSADCGRTPRAGRAASSGTRRSRPACAWSCSRSGP